MLKNMKKELIIISIIALNLITILFNIGNVSSYIEVFNASFVLLLSYMFYSFYGYRKNKSNLLKNKFLNNLKINVLVFYNILLACGFLFGFENNLYSLTSITNVLFYIIFVILTELIRYINTNRSNDYNILTYITTVFFSITMFMMLGVESLSVLIFIMVFIYNILLSLICKHLGFKYCGLFRLFHELPIFLLPIIPNTKFMIVLFITLSAFYVFNQINKQIKIEESVNYRRKILKILSIIFACIFFITVILVSGRANYYLMGIGSNSMSPEINRGDAVLVKKIDSKTNQKLRIGDIVVYKYNKDKIVHRISEIEFEDGEAIYITKGDNNLAQDEIELRKSDIEGVVKNKIPYIGYPSVLIDELIKD